MISVYLNNDSFDVIRRELDQYAQYFTDLIEPLNDRLNSFNMMIWFDGRNYLLNSQAADRSTGHQICLDDLTITHLMAMTDSKLKAFLAGF